MASRRVASILAALVGALLLGLGPSTITAAFACDPDTGVGCEDMNDEPPPSQQQTNPCAGYTSCTCVNNACQGHNGDPSPAPPAPPAGNFKPYVPPVRAAPPPPPPAGDFAAGLGNVPSQVPYAMVNASAPQPGGGAATSGPAVDVNGKAIASTKAADTSDATTILAWFLMMLGAAGLLILLMMANRV